MFDCNFCEKSFEVKAGLKTHLLFVHEDYKEEEEKIPLFHQPIVFYPGGYVPTRKAALKATTQMKNADGDLHDFVEGAATSAKEKIKLSDVDHFSLVERQLRTMKAELKLATNTSTSEKTDEIDVNQFHETFLPNDDFTKNSGKTDEDKLKSTSTSSSVRTTEEMANQYHEENTFREKIFMKKSRKKKFYEDGLYDFVHEGQGKTNNQDDLVLIGSRLEDSETQKVKLKPIKQTSKSRVDKHEKIIKHERKKKPERKFSSSTKNDEKYSLPPPLFFFDDRQDNNQQNQIKKLEKKERKSKTFECDTCNKKFNSKYDLNFHLIDVSFHRRRKSLDPRAIERTSPPHNNNKVDDVSPPIRNKKVSSSSLKCYVCGEVFKNLPDLKVHQNSEHSKILEALLMRRSHMEEIPKRKRKSREMKVKSLENNINITQNSVKSLTTTTTTLMNKKVSPKCDICKISFRYASELKIHQDSIHEQLKGFKCTTCGKPFVNTNKLRRHFSDVHLGIKKWSCEFCEKKFSQTGQLNAHVKSVHQKIKNFKCDRCGKKFALKFNLKSHIANVHEKVATYQCNTCSRTFHHSQSYKKHVRAKNCS